MTKRIFVGIPISKELQDEVLQWRGRILIREARWIEPKNLHITLVPPWESNYVNDVIEILKRSFALRAQDDDKIQDFAVNFNSIRYGPNNREPRMVWLSGQPPKEILDLRFKIFESLQKPIDSRPFNLHATLARLKNQAASLPDIETKVNWKMGVRKFFLYESPLLPEGSDYRVLSEFSTL